MPIDIEHRFDHVGLNVPDLDAAVKWYCDTLNLATENIFTIPEVRLRGAMLIHEPTGYRIELFHRHAGGQARTSDDAEAALGYGHICLRVRDVPAEFERLVAAGCTVRMSPAPAPTRPGFLVAFVKDPWGNLLEVLNRE